MSYHGDFSPGDVIDFNFTTVLQTGVPQTPTGLAVVVFKDNSISDSSAGVALTTTFDGRVGLQHVRITTATDPTFYSAGSNFSVVISAASAPDVRHYVVGEFSIEARTFKVPAADIAAIADQVWDEVLAGHLTAGSTGAALNGAGGGPVTVATASINAIADQVWDEAIAGHLTAGSTGEKLNGAGAAGDPWSTALPGAYAAGTAGNIVGNRLDVAVSTRLAPTTAGRTLDVTTTGAAGIDWGNVENPTTALALTGTTISSSQVVASVTGSVGSVTGAVGSVTGAVASVTGNVGGNVTGSVGSVVGNVGGNVTGSVGSVAANGITAASLDPTAGAEIADAVWDESLAGHLSAGSTGAALNAAGAAGDPWTTLLPGVYGAGTAGFLVGTNLDATVSSRATQASVTTLTGFVDTEVAAILAAVDTEVAAIKLKTDALPADPADNSDILGAIAALPAAPSALTIADTLLNRDMSAVSDTNARSPLNALRFLRNKWSTAAGTLTVTKENDTTTAWTSTLTTDPSANPVTASDPT